MKISKITSGFFWRFAERCGAQGVSLIVSIILARLLEPEAYGTIALITVFTTILNVFVDSGLGNALIQKKDADETDFSTVFFFNIAMCSVLYLLIFFIAPFIADFYKDTSLISLIRVLSITILISGVKNVQQAYISKNLLFKTFFYATLGGTFFSAFCGIWMAYSGFGVWSLVMQQIVNVTVGTAILWIIVKWRPKLLFSIERLKGLFSFGWKLLVSSLLDTIYKDIRQLIIGKLYSAGDLAFFNKGKQFPDLLINNVNSSIDSVLLPVMSEKQDKKETVRAITRQAIKTSTYILAPLLFGLAFTSNTVIELLLTKKWLPCVPYLCVFCITSLFYPIHTANLNAIKAMGRSDLFLKLEVIKKTIGVVLLLVSINFGVMAMTYSLLVSAVVSQIVNSFPNKKLLNYSYFEQIKDILPSLSIATLMGAVVYSIQLLNLSNILTLLIQVPVGIAIYILGSIVFKIDSFYYILSLLQSILRKRKVFNR